VKPARALPLLLLGLAAPAPAAAAVAQAPPSVSARLTDCAAALDPAERFLVAEGRMRRAGGAARMAMRFELQVRTPSRPGYTAVRAPGFGAWNAARPASRQFVYSKRVENLGAPAVYRMVVRFRWYDAAGRRLASARRVSPVCRQPDLRPDLAPARVDVGPGPTPETRRYAVPLRNAGPTASGAFGVVLTVGGRALPAQAVPGLAAGRRTELRWTGPACSAGETIAVRVDADGAVDESDEADNDLVRGCPAR
jgi:hypothetical protein